MTLADVSEATSTRGLTGGLLGPQRNLSMSCSGQISDAVCPFTYVFT